MFEALRQHWRVEADGSDATSSKGPSSLLDGFNTLAEVFCR